MPLLFSSHRRSYWERMCYWRRHFIVDSFCGEAWPNCGGHEILAQYQQPPHTHHKWREKLLGWENINFPFNPNMLHRSGVEDCFVELPRMAHFIWMIAWVKESLIGNKTSHVFITPTLRRPLNHKDISTCTFYYLMTYTLVLHTWRDTWRTNLLHTLMIYGGVYWWGGHKKRRRIFFSTLQLLEDKQNF